VRPRQVDAVQPPPYRSRELDPQALASPIVDLASAAAPLRSQVLQLHGEASSRKLCRQDWLAR
jgi:hypothetical protein